MHRVRSLAVLVVLPPSEGKTPPRRGAPLDLGALAFPALGGVRARIAEALVDLCATDAPGAASVLGLGATQSDLVARDAALWTLPTARADAVYSGVLFDALGLATLDAAARRRATRRVVVASGLFGLVRPSDRIPAYRLSGDTSLPGVGPVASAWRAVVPDALAEAVGRGLLVDLRSQSYAAFGAPPLRPGRTATVRVLQERDGRRSVVSHFNKATKGRIVRALLTEGADPRTAADLAATLRDLGWVVEIDGARLDVVVTET